MERRLSGYNVAKNEAMLEIRKYLKAKQNDAAKILCTEYVHLQREINTLNETIATTNTIVNKLEEIGGEIF